MLLSKEQLRQSPSGCYGSYVRMGSAGMKVYREKDVRDRCYALQRYLHKIGLAPYCHFCMEFDNPNGGMLYAYWSDHATCFKLDGSNGSSDYWSRKARELSDEIYNATGFSWSDGHRGNVGILDGCAVCIDCDPDYFFVEGRGHLTPADYEE